MADLTYTNQLLHLLLREIVLLVDEFAASHLDYCASVKVVVFALRDVVPLLDEFAASNLY